MFEEKQKKYVHIYADIADEILYFHSTSTPSRLGKALLDFIYGDLEFAFSSTEKIRRIHPYFAKWSDAALRSLKVSEGHESYGVDFSKLKELQQTYKQLLGMFLHGEIKWSEDMVHYLLRHPLYSSGTLVNQTIKNENRWMMDYFLFGFEDCLMCELMEMVRHRQTIKICKNCGRYFVPKRGNIDYCARAYTDDGKICADVGYTKTFAKAVQKDELLQAYTRAYKTHYARMTKPRKKAANMTRDEFDTWYKEAKNGLELARQGKIDVEAYKAWLKK